MHNYPLITAFLILVGYSVDFPRLDRGLLDQKTGSDRGAAAEMTEELLEPYLRS
jgi:hypothetical protein